MIPKNDCLDDADFAGFVLHALDPMETARCAAHLDTCFHCQGLLAEAMEMQDGMALLVPTVSPPRGFVQSIVKNLSARHADGARI